MPSTCPRSAFSIASEYSFASTPVSDTKIARMPAIGPSPIARTNTSAQMSWSSPRNTSNTRRVRKRNTALGITLRAPRKPSGSATTDASSVPRNAIATVSSIDFKISTWSQVANCDQSTISPTITQSRSRPEKIFAEIEQPVQVAKPRHDANSQCRADRALRPRHGEGAGQARASRIDVGPVD